MRPALRLLPIIVDLIGQRLTLTFASLDLERLLVEA